MSELVYKKHLFSSREFMMLSAYAGMSEVPVLFQKEPEPMNEKEINLAVFQLYQKGVLQCEKGNRYTVKAEVASMLRILKCAEYVIKIYSEKSKSPWLCFVGKDILIAELSENDHDMMKLYVLNKANFLQELLEREMIPEKDSQGMKEGNIENRCETFSKFLQKISEVTGKKLPNDEVMKSLFYKNAGVFVCMIISDVRLEQNQKALFILDCGIFDGYVFWESGIMENGYFTMDKFKQFLEL